MKKRKYTFVKCVHQGCEDWAETDGWRCVRHSIAYYGGQRVTGGLNDHQRHSPNMNGNKIMEGAYDQA